MKYLARIKKPFETISILMVIMGIFSLCQPFNFLLYRYSFAFLGIGTALYIFFSHIPSLQDLEDAGPVEEQEV